ncbi:MAG: radical SAM protein [Candidatus Omnitrophica bacterium]|nr:radical SAM protein [Candidatus Omnitrophota bacterium]
MKVELIYPDVSSFHGLPYHPGLASIGAVLKANGHEVRINYIDSVKKIGSVLDGIKARKPAVVGFTAVETQFPYVRDLARRIKSAYPCLVVCGGVFTTLFPEVVIEEASPLDAVIMGEGEFSLLDLVSKLEKGDEWRSVPNLAYRDSVSGGIVKNQLAPLMADLDALPFPATELFPYQDIIDRQNVALFHFNRGCPYRCTFCSNEALGKVYGMATNRMRYRTVESVMREITSTLTKYRIQNDKLLCFQDDLFLSDKRWITEFCAIYEKTIRRPFWCTARSNHINDDVCASLKRAGCKTLMMSVESGNDYIRNEVMKRNISREVLVKSFETCHRHGINTMVSCIIGLPFETAEMIDDSIKTMAGLPSISTYGINIFYPYKGTVLRSVCEEKGFMPAGIPDKHGFEERKDSILDLPALSKEKIGYYHDNWVRLIMKEKGGKDRIKYYIWTLMDAVWKSWFGTAVKSAFNNKVGRRLKQYVVKIVWNRY